ncbi:PH domain-containing protein [Streptomyces sp. TRM 70361]|uniref:PH domain-containing protein n=1 Tax=Streptomyces sp. TRM 70361 TaxID=3116553 RepID=UPI002E7C19F9|nr:PH domain-containing protein [Streptomyces sp. TRM 70361]MEE1939373.1 PH domain-containing protein [Streptomyces sp. TRM 70361]
MTSPPEVICRFQRRGVLWSLAALGAAGTVPGAVHTAYRGPDVLWLVVGLLSALLGIWFLHWATARVRADAYGLRSWTLLRRRSVPWSDIADLRLRLRRGGSNGSSQVLRVDLLLRDGRRWLLSVPQGSSLDRRDFDAKLAALRALHRLHGAPEPGHLPVISHRAAGGGRVLSLALCVLLLMGAGLAAWFVPKAESEERAWQSAVPCAAGERGDCLTTLPAVIERTEVNRTRRSSRLYFTDGRPQERIAVSREDALEFRPGDAVELTLWRGGIREVAGERRVWREHLTPAGDLAVIAAACVLAAGYPGALVLLRLRGRRLPDDAVLPSALPFAGALAGTALWLLPLCHLHPTAPPASPAAITWAAAGSLVSLALFAWAWRATRVRTPRVAGEPAGEEVFLAARFLEHTDYNPYGFGTHVVLGGGPPAVVPHPGPGRFAARRIPVERLTLRDVRRVRGGDGDTVPRSWHVAELDDAGGTVRLAAAPSDLARVLRELESRPERTCGAPGPAGS